MQSRPTSSARPPPIPAPRRATTAGARPVHRPWSSISGPRFFSARDATTQANAERLAHAAEHMDDPPAYIHDDSRMHAPFQTPRFGPLHVPSREGPDIELRNQGSFDHSQLGSGADESESADSAITDELGSDGQIGEYSQRLSQLQSVSDAQKLIDVMWEMEKAPTRLQGCFDALKEEAVRHRKALLTERKTSAKLSQDVEALESEVNTSRSEKKELQLQLSAHAAALQKEHDKSALLGEELQELRAESKKTKQTFEISQQNMEGEIDKLSKDSNEAKRYLQLKDKELDQVHREFARAKKDLDNEVKLRESAEAESQAFEQELFKVRKRSSEEKQRWSACEKDNKERINQLEELNVAVTSQVSALEHTVEKQNEANQIQDIYLLDVLVFVRSICGVVQEVYEATCAQGRPGLPEVLALPDLSCLMIDECSDDYEVLKELFESLKADLSPEPVLDLSDSHEEALRKFLANLILRDAAHSRYVCASDNKFKRMNAELEQLREHHMATREAFNTCKKVLMSEVENLVKVKEQMQDGIQEFKKGRSNEACRKNSLLTEVKEAKETIRNLENAASARAKMQHETEVSLTKARERLQTLLTQRKAQQEKLSKTETDLCQAKEELARSSKQAITDGEEKKRHMEALNNENHMLNKEKNAALRKATEAEFGIRQMSNKVTEAFTAKQNALEALVNEQNTVGELRSQLAKVSGKSFHGQVGKQCIQSVEPNVVREDVRKGRNSDDLDGHDSEWKPEAPEAGKDWQEEESLGSPPAGKFGSSLIPQEDHVKDLRKKEVPKKLKRRTPIQKSPKNPRQKRMRSISRKAATTAVGVTRRDSKPKSVPPETRIPKHIEPQTSSGSETVRDEGDWIVESVLLATPE